MSVDLLDKTRKINGLLRDNRVSKVAFTDLCQVLGDLLNSKVFVISSKGKILGMSPGAEVGILSGFPSVKGKLIDAKLSKRFLEVLSTKENVNLETLGIPREEVVCYIAKTAKGWDLVFISEVARVRHRRYYFDRVQHYGCRA